MATARTSRAVSRPSNPPKSNRAKSGEAAAASQLGTLADRSSERGRAILVHGPSGSGKTTLAIHKAPRPILVLDADNGLDSVVGTDDMEDIHIWLPADGRSEYSWADLDAFRNYVKSGEWQAKYRTIVPDNLTAIQKPLIRAVINEMLETAQSKTDSETKIDPDNPSQQGWGKIYRRFDQWLVDVRDAKRRGAHVIFTAGTSEWMDNIEGYTRMMPDIEGKERNQVATHMDAVAWLENEDGSRTLHLGPSGSFITKARLPVSRHDQVPDVIEDPDFNKLLAAVEMLPTEEPKPKKKTPTKKPAAKRRRPVKK